MALSIIPMLKYESPKFLQDVSFQMCRMHCSRMRMAQEQRPRTFKAAALLLMMFIESASTSLALYSLSRILLQRERQSLGLLSSRQRQVRYSAAERLFSAYFNALQRYVTASSAPKLRDFNNKASDFYQFYFISTTSFTFTYSVFLPPTQNLPYKFSSLFLSKQFWTFLFLYKGESNKLILLLVLVSSFKLKSAGMIINFLLISNLSYFYSDLLGASSIGNLVNAQFLVSPCFICSSKADRSYEDLEDSVSLTLFASVLRCLRLWVIQTGFNLIGEGGSDCCSDLSTCRSLSLGFKISISNFFFSFIYISLLLSYIFKCYILEFGSFDSLDCYFYLPYCADRSSFTNFLSKDTSLAGWLLFCNWTECV